MSVKYCFPVPVFHFWPKLMHPAARSLCDSWASYSDSTRLTMSKSISTPNFDKGAQSTAVLLLLLIWENGRPPYWNYTSGFDFTYWSSRVLVFCIDAPNLKFLAPTVLEIWRVQNFSRSRDPFSILFDLILHFFPLILLVVNLLAKCKVSSSNRSRDIEGFQNSKSRSRNPFTTCK